MRLSEGKQNQLNFREMEKTAVEWLVNMWEMQGTITPLDIREAKRIEKEQMIDFAFKYGDLTTREIADSFDKEYNTNEK
jgi:hypothetical protein